MDSILTQPIIEYNETDFQVNLQDYYTCLYYKGEPFTGTLVDENITTQFKNGNAHGKSVEYYDNGQLADESYFDDGNYVSYKTWHLNGNIKSEEHTFEKLSINTTQYRYEIFK